MSLARRLARQLARPHGTAGRLLGNMMDIANSRPLRLAVDFLAPRASEQILDAGCGTGAAMAEMLRRAPCTVTGIDPSPTMVDAAQARLRLHRQAGQAKIVRTSVEEMHFAAGTFDAVLALNVLYFCDAEGTMLARLARVLKPGGRLVAYVTHHDTMVNWPFARQGFHRLYDRSELAQLFEKAGFASERIEVHERQIAHRVLGLIACAQR